MIHFCSTNVQAVSPKWSSVKIVAQTSVYRVIDLYNESKAEENSILASMAAKRCAIHVSKYMFMIIFIHHKMVAILHKHKENKETELN